jgi:hypothetical protein
MPDVQHTDFAIAKNRFGLGAEGYACVQALTEGLVQATSRTEQIVDSLERLNVDKIRVLDVFQKN